MATLRIEGFDDTLYKALAARAARNNRSISQEVIVMVRDFLNRPENDCTRATEAFLALAGSWADDRPAKTVAREIRGARHSRVKRA